MTQGALNCGDTQLTLPAKRGLKPQASRVAMANEFDALSS